MKNVRGIVFCLPLFAVVVSSLGCGSEKKEDLPPMYPVTGTVQYTDGKPFKEGLVELIPKKNLGFNVRGDVKDGKFTLYVMTKGTKTEGAPEGEYTVQVQPAPSQSQEAQEFPPVSLTKTVVVKSSGKNHFNLKLRAQK